MNVCIIPARGGSKRITKKNSRLFCGKPIIAWSIENAINSNLFSKIIVSTDDDEIAEISKNYGAEIPYLRPEVLSGDYVPTHPVIINMINSLLEKNIKPDNICCLYATSPFTQVRDLIKAHNILSKEKGETYVFTATNFPFPIQRALRFDKKGYSIVNEPSFIKKRSQDLESFFHDAGQFYFASFQTWLKNDDFFNNGKPIILPRWQVEDIDNEEDWIRAEKLFKIIKDF